MNPHQESALPQTTNGEAAEVTALAAPPPRATYRLQFHAGFTFDDAVAILPYLARLGISHVYASPIQTARPGSTHGYDIVDHMRINPELGGEEGFLRLSAALKDHGLGLILDIVPNHMGIGGADNAWWLSVIEWGQLSPHAVTFDIDWERLGANGKLVLPFLGRRYGDALEEGELKLTRDDSGGGFSLWHFEHRFPISPLSYPILLDRVLILAADQARPEYRELLAISSRLRALSENTATAGPDGLVAECEALKCRLERVFADSPGLTEAADRALDLVNGAKGIPESFDTLHRILEMQSYRLANWRVAASDINYRRFFDINTLAGVRVEEPAVFERTHALILELVRADRIQGLRIDHIDGLADPEDYVRTLQAQVGPGCYILVEKILGHGETLRPWPMSGTTGYEVLNLIDGILLDRAGAAAIEADYREITGQHDDFEALLRRAKRETLHASFASELEVLVSDLARLAHGDRRSRDYTIHAMRQVLTEIIERLPVYRSYITTEASPEDRTLIEETVAAAIAGTPMPDTSLHRFVAQLLLGDGGGVDDGGTAGRASGAVPPPLPAAQRSGHGQEPGRHAVLPVRAAARFERSRRRAEPSWHLAGGFPRGQCSAAPVLAQRHDRHRDPRHQAWRGWARPAFVPDGDAAALARGEPALARDKPRAGAQRRRTGRQRPPAHSPATARLLAVSDCSKPTMQSRSTPIASGCRRGREGAARSQAPHKLDQPERGL